MFMQHGSWIISLRTQKYTLLLPSIRCAVIGLEYEAGPRRGERRTGNREVEM